jgi:hypothetical protein
MFMDVFRMNIGFYAWLPGHLTRNGSLQPCRINQKIPADENQ